jgi:hypothetical protein
MGTIALMGSGELTTTMVEVHKRLLSGLPAPPKAAFLDTPAGFQLNADQIAANAAAYFRNRVGCPLEVASYPSRETVSPIDAQLAFQRLRQSDYVLMGPGSPTYAVEQLAPSPVPGILIDRIREGGCLVSASAAALTVGRFTLPVYEIYKVGRPLHWVKGLDLLGPFGLHLVVIPHWNNAEGGTHDTSRCFMGRSRFERLAEMLAEETGAPVPILGLDEHTACIIDLDSETFQVRGIGTVTYSGGSRPQVFAPGRPYALERLRGGPSTGAGAAPEADPAPPVSAPAMKEEGPPGFWQELHALEARLRRGLDEGDLRQAAGALLEMDRSIWQAHGDMEDPQVIAQGRDLFRELLVAVVVRSRPTRQDMESALEPVIGRLLEFRRQCREQQKWDLADAIRDALSEGGVTVEDTPQGHRWRLVTREEAVRDHPT